MPVPSEDRLKEALKDRYVIQSELGEGGMATVYLAADVKHERNVALKVLKPELAAVVGADRFLAEIKTTANLQHPHILALYDSGEADGFLFYVMPYVEGETLQEKLQRERQLPVDEAILIASDMAEALDYAHRNGVIHRDIKPANVLMVEGRPVIADFGIALAVGSAGGARLTETGLSVGTPFYMSPEQATGDQVIGHQSDTYALGCVLYEMLIGEPPYVGATAQAVLGKIIQGGSVSATEHRKAIPAHVDAVIRKSLEKLPADRFASAAGFAGALREPSFRYGAVGGASEGPSRGWTPTTSAVAAVAVLAVGVLGWVATRPEPPVHVERFGFSQVTPEQIPLAPIELGPEGTGMVYYGQRESTGGFQLWYRRYDDLQATPVPNSNGGFNPSISPDGSEVAFNQGDQIWVVPLGGGVSRLVADSAQCCPSWSPDGEWIYATLVGNRVARVPRGGGAPEIVFDAAGEAFVGWSRVTPSGRSLVYTLYGNPIVNGAMDMETGERTVLTEGIMPKPTEEGYLVFSSIGGDILAAPFEEGPFRLTGPAVPLVEGVYLSGEGDPRMSLNAQGSLAYWEGEGNSGAELTWVTRDGVASPVDPGWTFNPGGGNRGWSLSPDGRFVAVRIGTDAGNDIWIKELDDGPLTRLTFWEGEDRDPVWLPDSRTVTFLSGMPVDGDTAASSADLNLWRQVADGSRPAELVYNHFVGISEAVTSPDGTTAVVRSSGLESVDGGRDIFMVDLAGDGAAEPVLATPFDESAPKLSPDGRWIAYQSNESGQDEIYVRPFPETTDARIQVSAGGGLAPRWARDGSELFYLNAGREMMGAEVSVVSGEFRVTSRERLFELSPGTLVGDRTTQYDVDAQGRFLMLRTATGSEDQVSRMVIVRNFMKEVESRLGGGD
jgi:serine/threonine-protein kinase